MTTSRTSRVRAFGAGCALAAALLASGCARAGAAAPVPAGTPSSSPTAKPSPVDTSAPAIELVPAIWRVRAAAGESPDTWIRFDTEVDLIRPRGDVELSWATQGDAILTRVEGWSMSLGSGHPTVPWLTSATRLTGDGDGWVLTDADGRRTARLVRDGVPPPSTHALHPVPVVDRYIRQQHADRVPGASVRPIDPAAAVGTWGLRGVAVTDGSVRLTADGSWTTRTTCEVLGDANGGGGSYRLLRSGVVLVTEGAIAGVGCSVPATPPPADARAILHFFDAGSIAVDGPRMTVYDRVGHRLGVLVRKS